MCKDYVLTHTNTQTHTLLADTSFPVLFPSATVGYDTAKKHTAREVMAEGGMRSRDGRGSQRKHHLEKCTDRKEKTERARKATEGKQKTHK